MRRARYATYILLIVPVFLVVQLSGCGSTGLGGGDFNLISIDEEWQMGQQLEAQIAQEMQLVNDPTALAYVTRLGERIVSQTNMAKLPWKFHIVADPAVNAFNIPGGQVYVNTGLIQQADNAAELAGVMAHEIGHGVERHATERLTKAYGISILAGLVLGGNPGVIQQIVAQIVATGAVAKFSRDDERQADDLGVRMMYAAGYDPEGMATMFQSLLTEEKRSPGAVEQFFSSHPLTQDRINDVRKEINQLPAKQGLITHETGFQTLRQRVASYGG